MLIKSQTHVLIEHWLIIARIMKKIKINAKIVLKILLIMVMKIDVLKIQNQLIIVKLMIKMEFVILVNLILI